MAQTPNLELSYLDAAQAQKHVTHNEALRALDAVVQISVLDRDLGAPPVSPGDGDRYLVPTAATGAWSGEDGKLAAWQDGAWEFYSPRPGWAAWVEDEDVSIVWTGAVWQSLVGGGSAAVNPAALVGVNATADATNRLSVSSPGSLFSHEGAGHQQRINKAGSGDTASQLYQTGFSGRAEIGLTGDDDFHFKVSPDGSSFFEAITIDKDSGIVSAPAQPCFHGTPTTDYSGGGMPTQVVPVTVVVNNGAHWNASTHRFTCPVAGRYLVTWGGLQLAATLVSLRKNGATVRNGCHYVGAPSYVSLVTSSIEQCAVGDFLDFYSSNGGGYFNGLWYNFSISLLG